MDIVSGLYSLASVSKSGTNWMRILHSFPWLAAKRVEVFRTRAPVGCKEFADELLSYMVLHYEHRDSKQAGKRGGCGLAGDSDMASEETARARFRQAGEDLLSILNGPLWQTEHGLTTAATTIAAKATAKKPA